MTYPLQTTARTPKQRRETRQLREARWHLEQMARRIDELQRRLAEAEGRR